ncbi:hypothetical protein ACFCP7_25510 [Paenibacillus elgii]
MKLKILLIATCFLIFFTVVFYINFGPLNLRVSEPETTISNLKFSSLSYKITNKDTEVGDTKIELKPENNLLEIREEVVYNREFVDELSDDLTSSRKYTVDTNFSLLGYEEIEKVGSEERFKNNQTVEKNREFQKVITKINNENKNIVYLPIKESIYVQSMGQLKFMFLKKINSEVTFNTLTNGIIESVIVIDSEILEIPALGKRNAYKMHTKNNRDNYYWIDIESGVLLKKEEIINERLTLISTLVNLK